MIFTSKLGEGWARNHEHHNKLLHSSVCDLCRSDVR